MPKLLASLSVEMLKAIDNETAVNSLKLASMFGEPKVTTRKTLLRLNNAGLLEVTDESTPKSYKLTTEGRNLIANWKQPVKPRNPYIKLAARPKPEPRKEGTNPFDWRNFKGA